VSVLRGNGGNGKKYRKPNARKGTNARYGGKWPRTVMRRVTESSQVMLCQWYVVLASRYNHSNSVCAAAIRPEEGMSMLGGYVR